VTSADVDADTDPDANTEAVTLALDAGGSKMAAGLVDARSRLVEYAVTPTPPGADAETLYATAVFVLNAALSTQSRPVTALGIGCGGPMKWPSGDVSTLNIPGWRDFPLRDRLADEFGVPTRIHDDAVTLTIGEHLMGAGRGCDNILGMVVSTGVGGGLISDGRLVGGASGNAGHIGHVVVDPTGPPCACGGQGCLEAVARGPALVAWALAQGWLPGESADAVQLAADARTGDAIAQAAFRRGGAALGTAIASVAALTDIDVVSIGGGISHAADLILPSVYDAFRRHAGLEFVKRCRIVLASPDAGLVGAAALFDDRYWRSPGVS
jgi:glucokinase